ncbi:hypothetical protein P154DRAFT_444947 [Amniculicola lignicola CBS 123094]|uniref:Uncharacterized protein n=1 Tax=Amniculicola lignicola CBS 123094 TaxID=1392246 RepID=A0A6A5W436_9PLEO|nr:hypothetical protein P154DRAFT_444947 [Amniculicola lignicola CBS 123094]
MSEDLDPSEFVQRIRQLGEQRDQQDAERVRKLEEEIIQGRSERLARRAERARSLSPDKPTTPQSLRPAHDSPREVQEKAADTPTPAMEPPSQEAARDDSLQRLTGSPAQLLESDEPKKPAPSAAALGRSGTLSWQKRPKSVGARRPLSTAFPAAERVAASSPLDPLDTPEPSSPAESTVSRTQIAQSLGAKDPSWFRQTPDRGIGSAAYRKSQEDPGPEVGSVSGRRHLPGLSRESDTEAGATSPPPASSRSGSPSMAGSARGSAAFSNRFSNNTTVSGGDAEPAARMKSPLPVLESQKFAPPSEQGSIDGGEQERLGRSLAMSPTQGRISPERTERSASPTKGMGGFVQSAMLKRSDSVNKRWSTQTPQGLTRQNSTVSNRASGPPSGYSALPKLDSRPSSLSRDNSMEPSSRPGSSSSNLTITKDNANRDSGPREEFVKPALPHHNRSKSVASSFHEEQRSAEDTSPPSPSKRWSPTKSSWLESALNKPETTKPKQAPPQQPAWMAEINRIKQQRSSVDLGKGGPLQNPPAESTPSGRSSPIKDVQLRPVSLKRPESPKKDEPVTPAQVAKVEKALPSREVLKPATLKSSDSSKKDEVTIPVQSLKPKPVLSPKPSATTEKESKPPEPSFKKEPIAIPKDVSGKPESKPAPFASRISKDGQFLSSSTKSKPDTPPKKDFRGTLRARPEAADASTKGNATEFQSVLGRLKRAETKNYVAPDTLKDNILRGKSGLALTGGPKPTVRKDEFRESLIKKKSTMMLKAQEEGTALKKADSLTQPTSVPEAIAKRKALGRSDSITNFPPAQEKGKQVAPEAIARQKILRPSKSTVFEKREEPTSASPTTEPVKASKLAQRFNPGLAGLLARGPPSISASPSTAVSGSSSDVASRPVEEEKKGPAPELTHITKGRARGPKRRAPAAKQTTAEEKSLASKVVPVATVLSVKAQEIAPSTKAFVTDEKPEDIAISRTPTRESLKVKPATPAKSPDLSRKLEKSSSPQIPHKPASLDLERKMSAEKTATPQKPTQPKPAESPKPISPSPLVSAWRSSRPLPTPPTKSEEKPQATSPLKESPPPSSDVPLVKESRSPERSTFSVKNVTARWNQPSASSSPVPVRSRSPIKLPTKADEQAALKDAGLFREEEPAEAVQPKPLSPKPIGLGLGSTSWVGVSGKSPIVGKLRESSPPKPYSMKALPVSPPMSVDRPMSEPFRSSPIQPKSDDLFAEFFDDPVVTTGELPENINTVEILRLSPLDLGKVRTLRKQMQEITGDGKLTSVPPQKQHILYQDSMYLCTHVFSDSTGARTTEVYLWAGNGVAESTVEDAQLFARNAAKQSQGKLIVTRQGKESPNFFEALEGIVITRRGCRPGSTEYMLCGRKHLGYIVFDEVDYSLKSLCSGFPYIVSDEHGKIYIWKGTGCSAEEFSGARLMGMDLTQIGEFKEVVEGSETQDFFNIFPPFNTPSQGSNTSPIPRSAGHWRYKPTSDKYRVRLFKMVQHHASGWGQGLQVSSFFAPLLRRPSWQPFHANPPTEQRPQTPGTPKSPPGITMKIEEISPFCQRDLEPEYIYLLDAFFEIYIIVGSLSRTQSTAFSTALMFAREYSIVAVSEEDRPFVPVTTIVLEGVPRDMKAVFRFWDDALIPAAGLMRGKLGRGKSLRLVGLEKAIQATRRYD